MGPKIGGWRRFVPSREVSVGVVLAVLVLFGLIGLTRVQRRTAVDSNAPPMAVPLFVDPDRVVHRSRFSFSFDPAEVLAGLRSEEELDRVVHGAVSDEQSWRRLMTWVRAQWQPGRPDPYPPPDARIILRDVRAGITGGFCAQYSFVLVQAIQSFGVPARLVTLEGHEVVEAWLRDEQRWVMFDPTYRLQVTSGKGRTLNALEVRQGVLAGEPLSVTADHLLEQSLGTYLRRYVRFAVWLRNDFISQPMNFTDFARYRVWFVPEGGDDPTSEPLRTGFAVDLYPPVGPSQ